MILSRSVGAITVDTPGHYMRFFDDRADAGAYLAQYLSQRRPVKDPLIFGLARGGVPVAAEVVRELGGELSMIIARKLGAPTSRELAIGAVTSDGGYYLNKPLIHDLAIATPYVERVTELELAEARRQQQRLGVSPPLNVLDRRVVLVDDGLATGATMIAAARSVRARGAAHIIVAVPVGAAEACSDVRREVDDVVCLVIPEPFWAVGLYYRNFQQVDDEEITQLLEESAQFVR